MKFWQVDSFTDEIFRGNPAAVFLVSSDTTESTMLKIAREMNLSETAFLHRAGERWNLRWFTPNSEVDLCGHATLAAAHVLWEQRIETRAVISFDTRSGELRAERSSGGIALDFPLQPAREIRSPSQMHSLFATHDVKYLGENGHDAVAMFGSASEVQQFKPDPYGIAELPQRGLLVTAPSDETGYDYVYRGFFPKLNIPEDPVTGSANTLLAPFWAERLGKRVLKAKQLSERGGELTVSINQDRVSIAGSAVTVFEGTMAPFDPTI